MTRDVPSTVRSPGLLASPWELLATHVYLPASPSLTPVMRRLPLCMRRTLAVGSVTGFRLIPSFCHTLIALGAASGWQMMVVLPPLVAYRLGCSGYFEKDGLKAESHTQSYANDAVGSSVNAPSSVQ